MDRRDFLTTGALFTTSLYMNACGNSEQLEATKEKPIGAITLYYEFNIAFPEITKMMLAITEQTTELSNKEGFLSLSLKSMIGSSTMVNNYLPDLKGVLKSAYIDASLKGRRPFRYALLLRFDSYDKMITSEVKQWFINKIKPLLFAYSPKGKTSSPFAYYQGIYKTIAGGDSSHIYTKQNEIKTFLKNQKDTVASSYKNIPSNGSSTGISVTVINHVTIDELNISTLNTKALALLKIAQQTYQPSTNSNDGESGLLENNNYKKAISTEILQNAYTSNGKVDYLFHGVWNSIADHENSHLDSRFMEASRPLGVMIIDGPFEPFYQSMILFNNN